MKKTKCFSAGGPDLRHDCMDKTSGSAVALSDGLAAIRKGQENMTDDERLGLWNIISAGYCRKCGSKHLPCYCWNDD